MSQPLVVITGASSGIGEALARKFSALGHSLLLLARREDRMQALGLPNAMVRSVDVTDKAAVDAAIAEAEAEFGPVDCLVNNAGLMLLSNVDRQDASEWSPMLNINIQGVLNGIDAVLQGMKQRKQGTIVNISSIAGFKPLAGHAVYCGTKHAVHAISESLRQEMAEKDVRVVTIAPGAVNTELLSHISNEKLRAGYEQWQGSIDGGLDPQQVADAVAFAYQQPASVCIRELVIAPTRQVI